MTAPDYPLLSPGGYETYQLAQIATFIADGLARHRLSRRGRAGRSERADALRDLALGRAALDAARGAPEPTSASSLPRSIDAATFESALRLSQTGERRADVVSMSGSGAPTWVVIGHVPGIGRVGAAADSADVAEGLRTHFLTRPAAELASWAVTDRAQRMPTLPEHVDLARAIEHLDPDDTRHRVVAAALQGPDPYIDAAVRRTFPVPAATSSPAGGPEGADDERRPVRDEGVPIAHPDQYHGDSQQDQDAQEARGQRVVSTQHEGDRGQQLDVSPAQGVAGQDGGDHGACGDGCRATDGAQAGGTGGGGEQQRGGEQRHGEHVGQTAFPRVDRGDRRSGERQRQPHREGPRPVGRDQAATPGRGNDGRGLGHTGSP